MTTTDLSLADALDGVRTLFDAHTTRRLGPQIIDARMNPSPNIEGTYSLAVPASRNLNRYRDENRLRVEHVFEVGFLVRLAMKEQYQSLLLALDGEEEFIAAAGMQADYQPLRLEYVDTARALTQSREYLVVQVRFRFDHDFGRHA